MRFMVTTALLLLAAAPLPSGGARAAIPTAVVWAQIRRADSLVRASRTVWAEMFIHYPVASADPSKDEARLEAELRASGATAAQAGEGLTGVRSADERMRTGFGYMQRTTFTYNGMAVREDQVMIRGTPGALIPGMRNAREYYQDKYITLGGPVGRPLPPGRAMSGQLDREASGLWRFSESSDRSRDFIQYILLAGAPISPSFGVKGAKLTEQPDGTVVLTRRLTAPGKPQDPGLLARLVVSEKTWRPVRFDLVVLRYHRPIYVAEPSDYRLRGGVWFPSRVRIMDILLNGRPNQSREYRLAAASFNSKADVSILKRGVPPGTGLVDHRFPTEPPVAYIVTRAGLPTDRQVWAMVLQSRHALLVGAVRRRLSILFYLGPLAVVLILVWRRRTPAGSSLQCSGADVPAANGPGKRDGASDDGSSHIDSDAGPAP